MLDAELQRTHTWPGVYFIESMIVMTFLQVRDVARLRKIAFVVEEMQNAYGLFGNQVDYVLIVRIAQRRPLDSFLRVLSLLQL